MNSYTLEDHANAVEALSLLRAREENYSGNNPNKFRADIARARAHLAAVELALKEDRVLQRTPAEERDAELDRAFPDVRSKEVVTWQGKQFIKRFTPTGKSLSGKTVLGWSAHWEELKS
ncbi:hypothetical protein LN451_20510 [Xanthomonas hortorum pv. gardneri]|uniref:hypothetical protein n=1 Tax=Xanthomonas TaxID=338 RepID=UPI001E53CCBB|nr:MULTISPECIES: hypothetical protein [Xanthomonas]MCC8496246.1 hypothetical protein [Xanthomonas hortorum pv. gardneri]MCE4530012.1 hypothetical protein [Xanthomonas hortorum pv. vitians]MEA9709319.1 hypothetical protein [Xanthomonas campestris]MEA9782913.1 hypothetical protein [Xanthomonas campestris pv. raphani]MEA9791041.1 hypothetical protein [Xanthomonas campestris pv. raphani]